MQKKLLSIVFILFTGSLITLAQTGALKVKLSDKSNNETIPFANIIIEQNGAQVTVGTTDINGEVIIKPLVPGRYTVKATYVGYQPLEVRDVLISSDKTSYLDPKMSTGVNLKEVEVVSYQEPLVDPDTKVSSTVTREEFEHLASKNINSVAATTAGVFQADDGAALNVRGSRSDANIYFIDGQRVIGNIGIPQQGIEQVTTITGGLPAQYGDATGGVISITTRGPSSKLSAGVEAYTSEFLDAFGYNQLGFNVSGPLVTKKDTATGTKKPILGFFVSGQAIREKDNDPSAVGYWKTKDNVLKSLEENPLRPNPTGGYQRNAEFITKNDLEPIKAKQNALSNNISFSGKLDYKPTNNLNITFGGSMNYINGHGFAYEYMLFNPVNNPQYIQTTWRGYGRLTQKFSNATAQEEEKSASIIKNAFYTLQAGYSKSNSTEQDDTHKDKFFDYGYIGKFTQKKSRLYEYKDDGQYGAGYYQTLFYNDSLKFEPGDKNPTGVNYTKQFYSYETTAGHLINNYIDVQQYALMNGDNAQDVYSMWYNTGRQYRGYTLTDASKFDLTTSFSADIKNHAVQLGLEYEQRSESYYQLFPVGLWTYMRNNANLHLKDDNLNTDVGYLNTQLSNPNSPYNYWDYERKYDASTQRQFDKNLRKKLGKPVEGTEWLDIDSYDPSIFSIDMFGADDLWNNGNNIVQYAGYDYTGKKLKKKPGFNDFFDKKSGDAFTRNIAPYQPIYVAGYIQDRFDFRDLKFNVGVRIDRFDANQPVLKDKYLLYEAKTAGEVSNLGTHPGNIGNDYVVYVNDRQNPTSIVGYRDGDTWYNAQGSEISDPAVLAAATADGKISPYLLNPNATNVESSVFKDYTPQINVMPRIGLSFPISDVANFIAHYDIITQRPTSGFSQFNPSSYYYLQSRGGGLIGNPDLKPQKTINYELGFTQVLNERKNSALTLTAFYLEKRDLIQSIRVNQAYPVSYFTYGNIDFSTVKGFTTTYDLRRTGNVSLTASYTLQFAEGTGSGANDNLNLISTGQPNLRFLVPLDFDQRHAIKTNIDYRFSSGADYNGPVWVKNKGADNEKTIQIFADMGANLMFNAGAGTPYSKSAGIVNTVNGGRAGLKGSVNGSNLPWQYRLDLRVDKNINIVWGKKEGEERKKSVLNINLSVFNLLNTKNILGVYPATGNPNDDGYLASAAGQQYISERNSPQSYIDLYQIKINNPGNYSLPRRIRLGVQMSF